MGKLIVPRHTADIDYIIPALKVYYDSKDWVDTATNKDTLVASLLKSGKETVRNTDETHYTKCSEIPRYFGFLERKEPGKKTSDVRITKSGIAFYEAYVNEDTSAKQKIIVEALENVVFGRNNEGCGSDVDCEAPNVVVVSALLLDGITNKEAAYILSECIKKTDYSEILLSVKYSRLYGDKLAKPSVTDDIKFILFLKRIGFMDDDGGGKSVVNKDVINKFRKRLEKLPLTNSETPDGLHDDENEQRQVIYYGTPGSGKSRKVKDIIEEKYPEKKEREELVFRTTFHPDSDYASFVGCYKPRMNGEKIKYEFVPQAFTKAYAKAWKDPEHQVYLVIEEINRGNCAQIFGDLFQLLDRKEGVSEYPINADADLRQHLEEKLGKGHEGIAEDKLKLPSNLNILATMNTSDQSLFPMDSAFKRRWTWECVPIDYDHPISGVFTITINEKKYNWHNFLKEVNARIKEATDSEDKQMGNFFIKTDVDEGQFIDKVMFYLWNDVCKEEYKTKKNFFRIFTNETKTESQEFTFNDLFDKSKNEDNKLLVGFMDFIGVNPE